MIRVDSITIKEFRGIREMTIDFKAKNYAICGPNGTGKSGVVDALEFGITGNISRLSGEGRGSVSLKEHAPHVDAAKFPEKAVVEVKVTIPSLGKSAMIVRTVKSPASRQITPADPAILKALAQLDGHAEIVLSRRELIRYVLATPGKRAQEVQALLQLDRVDQVRAQLQRISNSCEARAKELDGDRIAARSALAASLGIKDLTKENFLTAVNQQRAVLSLPPLETIAEQNSVKEGLATQQPGAGQSVSKSQADLEVKALRGLHGEMGSAPVLRQIDEAIKALDALAADSAVASGVALENFYRTGLAMIDDSACPLCDVEWNPEKLKEHVASKLERLKELSLQRKGAEGKLAPIISGLRKARALVDAVRRRLGGMAAIQTTTSLLDLDSFAGKAVASMIAFVPLDATIEALRSLVNALVAVEPAIKELEGVVAALPDQTAQDAARDMLFTVEIQRRSSLEARRKFEKAEAQATRARTICDAYSKTSDTVLSKMYADVEKDFVTMYAFVNRTDEDKFKAKLVPSMGKLGFDVDFYGKGFFPPGAYHSEGHQDGMGLCLYLALMRHLQGAGFTFAVLDDVLMSVDVGHRREVCTLLKKEFPNTQFIMTTHDKIWLRHMRTAGLIGARGSTEFRNWTVEQGPSRTDDWDVWSEIADYLGRSDVRGAAALLRHYLEYISSELCHRLRVPVEYRGDAQHQLGELLPPAVAHLRKLFKSAKDAANSWDQRDVVQSISALETSFAALAAGSKAEEWQINTAVHFNAWENLSVNDFTPVAKSLRELLGGFSCAACAEFLRVAPDRETAEVLRCECGKTSLNLKPKPKG